MIPDLESEFPNLIQSGFEVTSQATREYNCIAWALRATAPWWGFQNPGEYWPSNIPRNQHEITMILLFANEGFEVCDGDELEAGYEKIALYSFAGMFAHVARQLDSGQWTSKLGYQEDITHPTLSSLAGGIYGEVYCIMRRPLQP